MKLIQHWEGYALEEPVGGAFWARLVPVVGEAGKHEALIDLAGVAPRAYKAILPGAVFDWFIWEGDKFTSSAIVFRNYAPWTPEEEAEVRRRGKELAALFAGPSP
jgi:hypothetical protein